MTQPEPVAVKAAAMGGEETAPAPEESAGAVPANEDDGVEDQQQQQQQQQPPTQRRSRRTSELIEPSTYVASPRRSRRSGNRRTSELVEVGNLEELQNLDDDDDDDEIGKNNNNNNDNSSSKVSFSTSGRPSMPRPGLARQTASKILGDPNELSYHPGVMYFYRPPRQRQKWGQTQILPRINWGDLFFDLFYVAAAYNTSNILVEEPSAIGLLYFAATYLTVMHVWTLKTSYDARFVVMDDVSHRFFEVFALTTLACAVVHIRPVEVMSQPSKYIDSFCFCLGITTAQLMLVFRYIELYFAGVGQPETIKASSIRDAIMNLITFLFQLAATIVAGVEYFSNNSLSFGDNRFLAEAEPKDDYANTDGNYTGTDADKAYGSDYGDDGYGYDKKETTDVPIWLMLMAVVVFWVIATIRVVFLFPNDGSHKKFIVPLNIDFTIHRQGEYTMLMLGESILSLLIVDAPEDRHYFLTFYFGLATVMNLQFLHFRSQPHSADDHVMRRNKNRGMVFSMLYYIYSAALVALGAAFTLFVLSFSSSDDDSHRVRRSLLSTILFSEEDAVSENASRHEEGQGQYGMLFRQGIVGRYLAGGTANYPPDELEQRSAYLFSISLALIFFCLDAMSVLHVGFKVSQDRMYCNVQKKYNMKGIKLLIIRSSLIIFTLTLSLWVTEPGILAGIGLALSVVQILLRRLSEIYFPESVVGGGHGHH